MQTKFFFVVAVAFSVSATSVVATTKVESTFTSGLEGWSGNPSDESTAVYWSTIDGNPGSHLGYNDINSPNQFAYLTAPQKFLGDLTGFNGGTFGFDARLILAQNVPLIDTFGRVYITSNGTTVENRIGHDALGPTWESFSGNLASADWGVSEGVWLAILSNVTQIRVDLEPIGGANEIVGFDNFFIMSQSPAQIPLPPALALLAGAIGILGFLSGRRHV